MMTDDQIASIKAIVTAPRYANFGGAIKDIAFQLDLDLDIDIDKHFFRETVRFKISGKTFLIEAVEEALKKAMDEWNDL
jgi:hypothetical protein